MLAKLHCAVASVGFEVYLVVAVVEEGCSKVANVTSVLDRIFCDGSKCFAISVVASAVWHEVVDNTLKAFVSKNEVLPS